MAYTTKDGRLIKLKRFDSNSWFKTKYWIGGETHPSQNEAWHNEHKRSNRRSRKTK